MCTGRSVSGRCPWRSPRSASGRSAAATPASARPRSSGGAECRVSLDQQLSQRLVVEPRDRADGLDPHAGSSEPRPAAPRRAGPALRRRGPAARALRSSGAASALRSSRGCAGPPRCRRTAAPPRRSSRGPGRARLRRASGARPVRRRRQVHAPFEPVPHPLQQMRSASPAHWPIAATTAPALSASTARRAMNCASSGMLLRPAWSSAMRVLRDERLDAEPEHLRQVVIGGILAVRHELAGDRPALRFGDPLKRRGEIQAHDGRAILACHRGERVERRMPAACDPRVSSWTAHARMYSSDRRAPGSARRRPAARSRAASTSRAAASRDWRVDEQLAQLRGGRAQLAACRAALQDHARAPRVPVAGARLQIDELASVIFRRSE